MTRTIQERWTAIAEAAAECARVANTEPHKPTKPISAMLPRSLDARRHDTWIARMAMAELAFAEIAEGLGGMVADSDVLDDLRNNAGYTLNGAGEWVHPDDEHPANRSAAAYLAQRQGDLRTAQGQAQ